MSNNCIYCSDRRKIEGLEGKLIDCPFCQESVDLLIRENRILAIDEDNADLYLEARDRALESFREELEDEIDKRVAWQKRALFAEEEESRAKKEKGEVRHLNMLLWDFIKGNTSKQAQATPQFEWLASCMKKGKVPKGK